MFSCAYCQENNCRRRKMTQLPSNCPCLLNDEQAEIQALYLEEENYLLAHQSALVESRGYCRDTRVEEIIAFAEGCGYERLGLAFCVGLAKEAGVFSSILRERGFSVNSVACKNGAIPKEYLGIEEMEKVRPNQEEAMCNPIGQAMLLNKQQTELNIMLGLCVGHDALFIKYAQAPVTVLAVKDRVTGHNPLVPLYLHESYYKKLHQPIGE